MIAKVGAFLVVRSTPGEAKAYSEHKETLRFDFWYSCAYCTIAEAEATAIAFEIEHYVPVAKAPELANVYDNLMWACAECNDQKGAWSPPDEAAADGFVFFRPDQHDPREHFKFNELLVEGTTNVGRFTVEILLLNRLALRRIRAARIKLYESELALAAGLRALPGLPIDGFPKETRQRILQASTDLKAKAAEVDEYVSEAIARAMAQSMLLDHDERDAESVRGRRAFLQELRAIHPGKWNYRSQQKS